MYAIINIAGQQFKVEKDQQIFVHRLPNKEGEKVTFDEVLLIDNGGKVEVGAPAVSGASVTAKVIEHVKGDKVIVFKKKRRKGYQKSNGHRQQFTKIAIDSISLTGAKKSAAAEKPAPKVETPKAEAPKKEVSKKETPKVEAPKKEAPKAEAPKKEAAKKETPKAKKGDDLRIIEGIGPKIAEVLNNAGILTFSDLASTTVEKLKEILSEAGGNFASHNPGTWPKQAEFAAEGKFDELKEWQDKLDGGVEK